MSETRAPDSDLRAEESGYHHSSPHRARPSESQPGEDWLEVFYDVVTGIAVIELSAFLSAEPGPDLGRYLTFVGLLLPIWWVWMGWTVYNARFSADDAPHRLLTFVQMLASAVMVVQIRSAHTNSAMFAGAFVVARLSLLGLYLRARQRVSEAAPVTAVYFRGFSVGASLWAISIFTPMHTRHELWAAGLATDFFTPWLGRSSLERMPLDASHLLNRLGAFASTILAVTIAGVIGGVADMHWNVRAALAALLGFIIAVSIWWLRAEFIGHTNFASRPGAALEAIYINLPIVIGLCTLGVGVQLVILRAATGQMDPATFWLLGFGAALWLATYALINLLLFRSGSRRLAGGYAFALAAALAQPVLGPRTPAPLGLTVLAAAFVALVLADTRPHTRAPRGEPTWPRARLSRRRR